MDSKKTVSRRMGDVVKVALAALLLVSGLTALAQAVGVTSAGAAAPVLTGAGVASYVPTGTFVTTVAAASNGAALPQGTINVASTTGFPTSYNGLMVMTSAGPQSVYCSGTTTATTFTTCTGGTGTMTTGGAVSSTPWSTFDVDTLVTGGSANVTASSITILTDVPAADRAAPSVVSATASHGLIEYIQSAAPTGTFSLTFGLCNGVATYSATNPLCTTGTINYVTGVGQDMGDVISVLGGLVKENVYNTINVGPSWPANAAYDSTYQVYEAPEPSQIPSSQSSPIGNVTVTSANGFNEIFPIPTGFTVAGGAAGVKAIGGDTTTQPNGYVAYCTAASTQCTANTGTDYHYAPPYVEIGMPTSVSVAGGATITMPTAEITLQATGAPAVCGNNTLTEFNLTTVTSLATADFDGYPTSGSNTNVAPPTATPTNLATTCIVKASQTITPTTTAPANATVGGPTYTPAATASSNLTVAITLDASSTGCSLASGVVSFTAVGTCVIDFNQAGNTDYNAATQVQQSFAVGKTAQTITTTSTNPGTASVGGPTYTPTATASSGLTVAITIDASSSSVCSITGGVVSYQATGTCTIDFNQAGNGTYAAAPQVQQAITVGKTAQTITTTSTAPAGAVVAGPTYTPTATASSGLTVAITVDASSSSVCSITGGVVSFQTSGTCTVDFNQAGNATYAAAPQVQQSFAVGKGSQTVSFTSTAPAGATVGGATYTPTATATSGLTATITVDATASSVCSITGGVVSFQTAGTCVLDANQAGNANYSAAPQVQQSFAVGKGSQTVSFTSTAPASATVGGATYTPTATATSGLTAAITVDATASSVCSITAGVVSFQGAGTCVLDANQAGNANYSAAPQVQQSFAVGLGSQTITITSTAPAATVGGPTYTVTATGGASGNPVTFTIDGASTAGACSIAGAVVSFTGAGTCIVDANQAGNANYAAADQKQQTVTVAKGSQTITTTSTNPGTATVGGPTYTPTATASSGLTVTITIDASSSSVCSITAGVVSYQAPGTCTVDFNQAGNTNYNAASQVQQAITVAKGSQTITTTSTNPGTATVGGPTYTPTATASSGLTVAITIDASSSSVCSITAGVVSYQAVGTCTIDFNQAGNATYAAAPQVQQAITVSKGAQTITPTTTNPGTATVGGATYTPAATASSGLAVTITIDASSSSVCKITAGVVSYQAVGTCTVDFNQAGNANYNAASQVQQAITVSKGTQTITPTSTNPGTATVGGATYTPTATASSGLTVAITIDATSSTVCSITAGVVSYQAVGTCTVDFNQAGNANYTAASQVQLGRAVWMV